jgi:catechol 2,3-dioxygenase-like lactoylglutathione lyase family enzyme
VIGLHPLARDGEEVELSPTGTSPALLALVGDPSAPPRPPRTTGLFHFALLVPERRDLGRALVHVREQGWPFQGFADHSVSESLYLADPEGNGIEIYADRPRSTWVHAGGEIRMTTDPLDVASLIEEAEPRGRFDSLPRATVVGHIHLEVSDLDRAEEFYVGLGFDPTVRAIPAHGSWPQAATTITSRSTCGTVRGENRLRGRSGSWTTKSSCRKPRPLSSQPEEDMFANPVPPPSDDATAFVLRIGEALNRHGAAATRVEQAMELCSERFGLEGQFFGTPTSIFAAFGSPGRQTVGLVRVEPGSVDLGKGRWACHGLLALRGAVHRPPEGRFERSPRCWRPRSRWWRRALWAASVQARAGSWFCRG